MSFKIVFAFCLFSLILCDELENTLIVPSDQDQLSLSVKAGEPFSVQLAGNVRTNFLI